MTEINPSGYVEIRIPEYNALVRAAEHYKNIINVAINDAKLYNFRDEINLNTNAIEDYIKITEHDKVLEKERRLKAEKELELKKAKEAAAAE